MESNRGGAREGAGRKPSNKQTVVIRVPIELLPMIKNAKLGKLPLPAPEQEIRRTGAIKPKRKKKGDDADIVRHSTASQFSRVAISQLERIRDDDHDGIDQLTMVMDWIKNRIAGN